MNKIANRIKPCIIATLIFIVSIFLLKIIETSQTGSLNFSVIIRGFAYSMIVSCCYSVLIFPLFLLFSFIQKKLAWIVVAILFGILTLFEIGLTIYTLRTGSLMGQEIIIRPLSETIHTIRASMNIFLTLFLIAFIMALFIFLGLYLQKKRYPRLFLPIFSLFIIICSSFIFTVDIFVKKNEHPIPHIRNYIIDKSWYCINSSAFQKKVTNKYDISDINALKFEVNPEMLDEFISNYPHRVVVDSEFPLERKTETIPDVLSPFFKESDKKPNVVIIVCESLGRSVSGDIENELSFTPFLDSLASHGLYWENCITTTSRSYGAVPAITASVPYGLKGFQFGMMPEHYSILSILGQDDYQTNAFYGGDLTFDNIYDFLLAQDIDYMSNYLPDLKQYRSKGLANWSGVYDHILFDESIHYLNENGNNPFFNLYITLTSHDPLNLKDEKMQNYYLEKTKKILSQYPVDKQSGFAKHQNYITSFVYLDDCINKLIQSYRLRDDFENTIFIITGDHATGIQVKNQLSSFHVPLIIWSPLLKESKTFPAIVTHNGISPSLLALLESKYGVSTPEGCSWISDGLDTVSFFESKEKMLFLNYAREIEEMLYKDYFYFVKNKWREESLYQIDTQLNLIKIENDKLVNDIARQFNTFKYVNNYLYHNNRLMKSKNESKKYELIAQYKYSDEIICTNPDYKYSKKSITYNLLPEQSVLILSQGMDEIRTTVSADIYINDSLWIDEYMDLKFTIESNDKEIPASFKDKIVKYVTSEIIRQNEWYQLYFVKHIPVENVSTLKISLQVEAPKSKEEQKQNTQLTIKNVNIKIEGEKTQEERP
ncbi:MAG: sulfatase-like hydrolase/transferase [Bacteroidales bacterium]|jgi:uncharacterized sulfatase|nr:sulfatase-like hydrolase/transferase [Bacteroidales bacterium]